MNQFDLSQVPNQSFETTLDDVLYTIELRTLDPFTVVSITADGVSLVKGIRALPFVPLLPYKYKEASGNFIFATTNGEVPYYTSFGTTQALRYYSADELAVFRSSALLFDPSVEPPRRFKPVGY